MKKFGVARAPKLISMPTSLAHKNAQVHSPLGLKKYQGETTPTDGEALCPSNMPVLQMGGQKEAFSDHVGVAHEIYLVGPTTVNRVSL